MKLNTIHKEVIEALVRTAVESYANGFQTRHISEVDDPEGVINMKIHNVFIEALGKDIQYYAALVRSLDSSLGNMLETLAMNIANVTFDVYKSVEGPLYEEQTIKIASLLEKYKRTKETPHIEDYKSLRTINTQSKSIIKRHDSDYYLVDPSTNNHYLIELKIGGDLDNKKARAEKEAILEQYAILSNTLDSNHKIVLYFATAYNRYGENKAWNQSRVKQFFAQEELLIGRDFWNFICRSNKGYETVVNAYKENCSHIQHALQQIKNKYIR